MVWTAILLGIVAIALLLERMSAASLQEILESIDKLSLSGNVDEQTLADLVSKLQVIQRQVTAQKHIIKKSEKEINAKKSSLEQEVKEIEQIKKGQQDQIRLNVGGTVFVVAKSTLLKDEKSMFGVMFSGRFPMVPQADGSFFIDRDPTHFRYILNYLRDDRSMILPDSYEAREELLQEANYYQIQGLIDIIQGRINRDKAIGPINVKIRDEENHIRMLFAKDPKNSIIQNPYCHLIDVFAQKHTFIISKQPEAETNNNNNNSNAQLPEIPVILSSRMSCDPGPSIVDSIAAFKKEFYQLCPNLKNLNWNNVFVAGGSVLCTLKGGTARTSTSDIDVFLYGMNQQQALQKIEEIEKILKGDKKEVVVVRTSRTLTFVSGYPTRHVQVILRLYNTPAEVLLGFDLDCVGCGFDGNKVWALPRCRRALNLRYNIADPTRQTFRTTSYEYRLWKYSKRGFGVAIPGFNRSEVNTEIYQREFPVVKGLAKLLLLEERDFQHKALQQYNHRLFWFYDSGNCSDRTEKVNSLETLSLVDEDVVCHVIDYNNGVLLPFSEVTNPHSIFNRLTYRATTGITPKLLENRLQHPNAAERMWTKHHKADEKIKHLYYVFGWSLKSVMDAEDYFIMKKNQEKKFVLHVPRYIQFIGSLQEYMDSLPQVEDDWYSEAISKHKTPKLVLEVQ